MSSTVNAPFELLRTQEIESLHITVEEYRHKVTGAQHIHLSTDNQENVFLVALRTVPHDSTGVAHILEHTALCGSEKYPVRDPFFMMIRRSLNTFMNAFTSSDWTAYPFASQNRKDFNNLLDVYLDAVFFSRLDALDFAQEGHRVEFSEPNNSDSPLVFKGVVYNEMKGAMSSVPSQLWQTACKYLFPTTTYHYNSGGEPDCIPDLSYAELKAFYKTHYHPSNAIFMTFGDIPAAEHQAKFEEKALHRFERLDEEIRVGDEKRYQAPVRVQESYPVGKEDELDGKTHIVLGWLLGKSTNLEETLKAQLLTSVLLDNSASPLSQALETTELGSAPSPLCGLDDSQRELSFLCGIEGSETEKADAVEAMVLDVIRRVAEDGVPQEQIEAALHQLELQQREIGGDSYPYGLQLILTALSSATHRGDPIALLNLEPVLNSLREQIKNPDFIKLLAKDLLLNNQHRIRLVMTPDNELSDRRQAAEKARLELIKQGMSEADKEQTINLATALQERQTRKDDESILPKVGLEDIPKDFAIPSGQRADVAGTPLTRYGAGTNGIVYQQAVITLPQLTERQLQLLPVYTMCLTELGVGDKDYLATQHWQSQTVGSINAYTSLRGTPSDPQNVTAHLTLSAKALTRNYAAMTALMSETLDKVRFDEHSRIRDLISQARSRREQSVTGNGHSLAMTAATAGISSTAALSHKLSGLAGIKAVKALDNSLKQPEAQAELAAELAELHELIKQSRKQFLLVAEDEQLDNYQQQLTAGWSQPTAVKDHEAKITEFNLAPVNETVKQAWITNTQVNFCAKAYRTVPMAHTDAPALTVLGGFLRNGYLHRVIREQGGAYGGGASQDSNIGAFRFYSYRDPRLAETLTDFDNAIDWLKTHEHEPQQLEEAVLGVISAIDKPSSPAGEAKQSFHAELYGRTPEIRRAFRAAILTVTLDDLIRVATTYFIPENENIAVVTSSAQKEDLTKLGLETISL